jgi:DNA primase
VDGSYREGDLKARVLESTNIVELVSRSVRLTRRGKEYWGLCPFHQEKTPSFQVNEAKQLFHCQGCKKGGNAIDFVILRDRIEFKDALRQMAEAANIPVDFGRGGPARGETQILRDALGAACQFFENQLAHSAAGKPAREYLRSRGFDDQALKLFRVGLAMDAWDSFMTSPAARKFQPGQLALAGLIKPRESGNGHYDTFRNRLMFPIRDMEGRVIAFGGRVMPGSEDKAKYLNSPETPLFAKGRCIFGLDLAKDKIIEGRTAAIVEGYTDVMMAHQFGCRNVVSTLGTALTAQHVTLLRRYADKIVLLFDPDSAGDAAADRAVELCLTQENADILVANLPGGADPDQFLLENGAAAFESVLANATDALTYKWKQLDRRYKRDVSDLGGQQKAVSEYLGLLAKAREAGPVDLIRWGVALSRVSRLTEIPVADLHRRFKTRRPKAAGMGRAAKPAIAPVVMLNGQDRAEAFILGYLMSEPAQWAAAQKNISPDDFTVGPRRSLAEIYWRHQQDEGEPVFNQFLATLDEPLKELAVELVVRLSGVPQPELTLRDNIEYLESQRERLTKDNWEAQLRGGDDEVAVLRRISETCRNPDLRRLPTRFGG